MIAEHRIGSRAMFLRVKTAPESGYKTVQLVESVCTGKAFSQRIVRRIGVARSNAELDKLMELGEVVKADAQRERAASLLVPEDFAEAAIKAQRAGGRKGPPVAIEDISEECRVVTGIHEACGAVYRQLGFDGMLPSEKDRSARKALCHTVMARIANPDSKSGIDRPLEAELGLSMPVKKICRTMDRLDDGTLECMKSLAADATRRLLPERPSIAFFYCTPLHFESVEEDGWRGATEVLMALMAATDGLPLGFAVFLESECEGKSLIPSLERMRKREQVEQAIYVADRDVFGERNLKDMEERGLRYIVGTGWDGLKGIAANIPGMGRPELRGRYRGLRQVEESFRVTKHDLEMRPTFDWTPERVKAHIAIAYMAHVCLRHLEFRVALQQGERMTPERIRKALAARQCSIMRDGVSERRYALPSTTTPDMERICRAMELPISRTSRWIE